MQATVEAAGSEDHLYKMRKYHRVVVTGLGAVTPNGLNMPDTWQARISGKSGIRKISTSEWPLKEDVAGSEVDIAGLVMNFNISSLISPAREINRIHRASQFALASSWEAMIQAGFLDPAAVLKKGSNRTGTPLIGVAPDRFGIINGTGIGGGSAIVKLEDIIRGEKADKTFDAYAILLILMERVATVPSMFLDSESEVATVGAACATGALAIANAARIIMMGEADVMEAGAAEAAIHRVTFRAFNNVHALNNQYNGNPSEASRPFDRGACGFVMGEGSTNLILESLEHAIARKAEIFAELVGYGNTADASHETNPNGIGAVRAMRKALAMAEIDPSEVDYINAHGTSTPTNDPMELNALREVFGKYLPSIPISSDKGATGHPLGASGAMEAGTSVQAIRYGIVPPNLNLQEPIAEGEGLYFPLRAERREVKIVMSNSFGFGGENTVLVFRKYQESYQKAA